ncbi:MAG: S8 family peptidase [Aeromicrobium sp.]
MQRRTSMLGAAVASIALSGLSVIPAQAETADSESGLAKVQPFLAQQLATLEAEEPAVALVHGATLADATRAVATAGMVRSTSFDKIGVVVAAGTKQQIEKVRGAAGITYVEGNQPLTYFQETSNQATRGDEAYRTLTGANGTALSGEGVSVGVIDSGVDPTHPYLKKAVAASYKSLCEPLTESLCQVVKVPNAVDTDTLSAGGHGTHVAGIVAGAPTTLSDGGRLHGAAPGAKVISISTGAGILIVGADASLNWVLENHARPCGAEVSAAECPPIKVTNNSYGPSGGGDFDPQSATVKLQRALAAEGVVTVWANGNDGGDGSESLSNPPGQDPTGGVISVASYYDQDTGTRSGTVSDFSSRGKQGALSTYPDISAPGEDITSSCRLYLAICSTGLDPRNGPGPLDIGTFNTISGTSMAAPHIAGIVAQLFQANPAASPAQVEDTLKRTAHKFTDGAAYEAGPLGTTSYDKGHGLVDVVAAAAAIG